jgi:hypothetical protein
MSDVAPVHIPTVDDLRVKLCYICREEETADAPKDLSRAASDSTSQRWVHPCKCTLVAHEDCLLQWIRSAQSQSTNNRAEDRERRNKAFKCPQCGSTYELTGKKSVRRQLAVFTLGTLSMELVGTLSLGAVGIGLVGGFVYSTYFRLSSTFRKIFILETAVYTVTTTYGAHAVRSFVGQEVYDIILGSELRRWPALAFIHLPMITGNVLAAKLRPSLLFAGEATPILLLALTPNILAPRIDQARIPTSPSGVLTFFGPAWPPSPFLLAALSPFIRHVYRRVWKWFAIRALGVSGNSRTVTAAAAARAREIEEPVLRIEIQERGDAAVNAENAAAAVRSVALSSSVGRAIAAALLMPAVAAGCGAALLRLSRYSSFLRSILAPRATSLGAQSGFLSKTAGYLHIPPGLTSGWSANITRLIWGSPRIWTECDPVWWRNTLGITIAYVVSLHLFFIT